jgi:hypothetical protein
MKEYMKKLFWIPLTAVLLFLGFAGFFVTSGLAVLGGFLAWFGERLGLLFDWYHIQLLRLMRYTGERVGL